MAALETDRLRQQLIDVIQATVDDVHHPWFLLRPDRHPDRLDEETAWEIASVAVRCWRSGAADQRDPAGQVAKLANCLYDRFPDMDMMGPNVQDDFAWLANRLAEVLRRSA